MTDSNNPEHKPDMEHMDNLQGDSWRHLLMQLNPLDLLSARNHSQDFNGSRAEYILVRVRLLALIFAVLTPLWIPIDYLILSEEHFLSLMMLRLATSGLLFMVALAPYRNHDLKSSYRRLMMMILILNGFYVGSRLILGGGIPEGPLIGYTFLPFLITALLCEFPLTMAEGLILGMINLSTFAGIDFYFGASFTLIALSDFWLIALLFIIALWAEMAQLHMLLSLYRQATRDTLTGLFNRRALTQRLTSESYRVHRYGRNLSVLLFDLDRFKRINDEYGHLTGDAVLKIFAEILQQELRNSDLVGRYGGEEFIALLPETPQIEADDVAERIRAACESATACGPDRCVVDFTTSIGVAQLGKDEPVEAMLRRIDAALYRAKDAGRNCVISDIPTPQET